MYCYIFAATEFRVEEAIASLESVDLHCGQIFGIALSNENEFEILMSLLGVTTIDRFDVKDNQDFHKLYDYSYSFLPTLDESSFDKFYASWLESTGRESTIDEYGQLIFLQGIAKSWNVKAHRFVLLEKND